jgi:hypothetical protein
VTVPAEIDVTIAEQLRMALLDTACHGHVTVAMDLTGTGSTIRLGLKVLVVVQRRARLLAVTGLDRFIPCFRSLEEALGQGPPCDPTSRPQPSL